VTHRPQRGEARRRRDFKAVAAAALASAERVVLSWLPHGKREGREWKATNPTRSDARAGSFSVNLENGKWADFASDQRGGDLVALVKMLDGCTMAEACDRLSEFLGLDPVGKRDSTTAPASPAARPQGERGEAVAPVPDNAPAMPAAHPKQGRPSLAWDYRDAEGRLLFRVARFNKPDGAKEVMPLSLWREGGRLSWRWRGLPEPRPLYGLEALAAKPGALVVVTEGEKDADAARVLLPDLVVITSPNGSRSAGKAAWGPVHGRRLVVWPDADEPGAGYAADVARAALAAGAASVSMIRLDRLAELRGSALPDGWGAADALAEGLDAAGLAALLADPAALQAAQAARAAGASAGQAAARGARTGPRVPFLHVPPFDPLGRRAGVYYVPAARDRETGETVEGSPEWVCSPLKVEALTRDHAGGEWGRLLVFPDRDGTEHRWAMPSAMLAKDGAELREVLLSQGLEITADPNKRRRLVEYIQAAEPGQFARCVTRAGWHGDAFVLPAGTVGALDGEALVFQSAAPGDHKLSEAGQLSDWREQVSAPCAGNARLVVALSAAFAAPCLHLAGLEGGGLHFRGASSSGKSTALALAASVYGPPEFRREWRATDNALESVAALHCDALLPLDEIGQLEPKHAAAVAYLLSNGQGKSRSRRDGSLRAPATWRLLFLSCGEVGLGDLIAEAGGKSRAGMEVRVVDLSADAGAGLGIFQRVPDGLSPGAFADRLKAATALHYGTAFPAFLRALVGDLERARRFLRAAVDRLGAELAGNDAAGQARRVARRFALVAAAGELATAHGLTGWATGEAERAGRACYLSWLGARGGNGESEPRDMIRQVQHFLSLHSEGRFAPMSRADDDRAPKTLLRAGWRVESAEGMEHWVLSEVWRREVCEGFDPSEVCRVLVAHGLLKPEGEHGYTRRERIKGTGEAVRVLRLLPGILEFET
jgi:putative DNA primase/helicase